MNTRHLKNIIRFRNIVYVCALLFLLYAEGWAQEFTEPGSVPMLRFDSTNTIDMWSVGGNPAWFFQRAHRVPLQMHWTQHSSSGDFRRPFEPGRTTVYQYYVDGEKLMSERHAIRGSFGVTQEFRGDWMWSDTKNFVSGSPFLIADSSVGLTDFRGIVMNGTYSGQLAENLLIGATVRYGVDNGVKRVSPKPISSNRDIAFVLGGVLLIDDQFSIGAILAMQNGKEENDFEADQTTAQSQTVLFKFRSYDTYQRLTKNSENRLNDFESYAGTVQGSYTTDRFTWTLSTGGRVRTSTITDGGSSPISQGYWQSEILEGEYAGSYDAGSVRLVGTGRLSFDHQWTEHPDFSVVLSEQHLTDGSAGLLASAPFSAGELFCGYSFIYHERVLDDYLSRLSTDMSNKHHLLLAGAKVGLDGNSGIRFWYEADFFSPDKRTVAFAGVKSLLYSVVGEKYFGYELATGFGSTAGISALLDGGKIGNYEISILYRHLSVETTAFFPESSRSTVEISFSAAW